MQASNERRVAIIGAGISGLIAARRCFEHGLQPTIFEKAGLQCAAQECDEKKSLAGVGGMWRTTDPKYATFCWPGLRMNGNRFQDLRFPDHLASKSASVDEKNQDDFSITAEEVEALMKSFAEKFNLVRFLRCGHNILKAKRVNGNQEWEFLAEITSEDGVKRETLSGYHYLIMATSAFGNPRIPDFPGMKDFKGEIMHSARYQSPHQFDGKTVVVIGSSISAYDQVGLTLQHSSVNKLYHVIRRRRWLLKRCIDIPMKVALPFLCKHFPEEDHMKLVNLPILFIIFRRCLRLPSMKFAEESYEHDEELVIGRRELMKQCNALELCSDPHIREQLTPAEDDEINLPTVSDEYLRGLEIGIAKKNVEIIPRDNVKTFTENGIVFSSGRQIECDLVLCATGYDFAYDLFEDDVKAIMEFDATDHDMMPVILYKSTMHPAIRNLAFVGCNPQPAMHRDLQAKWVAMTFSGKVPHCDANDPKVQASMAYARKCHPREKHYEVISLDLHVDYVGFCDSIAKITGHLPDLEKIKEQDLKLYDQIMNGPVVPEHWMLNGSEESLKYYKAILDELEDYLVERARRTMKK